MIDTAQIRKHAASRPQLIPAHKIHLPLLMRGTLLLLTVCAVVCVGSIALGQLVIRSYVMISAFQQANDAAGEHLLLIDAGRNMPPQSLNHSGWSSQDVKWDTTRDQFFFKGRENNVSGLYVTDLTDFSRTLVAALVINQEYDWSPIHNAVIFANLDDSGVQIVDVASGTVQPLFETAQPDRMPVWSPDENQIAFVSKQDRKWSIYVANADGTNLRLVTNNPPVSNHTQIINWSPDGEWIAYIGKGENIGDVFIVRAADGLVQTVMESKPIKYNPLWSPDGQYITFWSYEALDGMVITVVTRDGKLVTEVKLSITGLEKLNASWSNDSRHLALGIQRNDSSIYLFDLDVQSGTIRQLMTGYGLPPAPVWIPQ